MVNINGTCTAMVVPFKEDLTIDYDLYQELCYRQAAAGNHIVSPGTTTESPTLTPEEHVNLIKIGVNVVGDVNGSTPYSPVLMVAGVGSNSTREAIEYAEQALSLDADAGMSVTPYYNKPSQKGHLAHQVAIADVGLPIMMYNIPGRSASGMTADTILRAFEHPKIVSLKAAAGYDEELLEVLANKPNHVSVLCGDDVLSHAMLSSGAQGLVSVSSNMVPQEIHKYISNFDHSWESLNRFKHLRPLLSANMAYGNPVTIKESMYLLRHELGIPTFTPNVRLPLVRMGKKDSKKLEGVLRKHFSEE